MEIWFPICKQVLLLITFYVTGSFLVLNSVNSQGLGYHVELTAD